MRMIHLNPHAALLTSAALVLVVGLPLQPSETDRKIETSIKNSYNFKTYLKSDDIQVKSTEGVVTLTGSVSKDYHKSLAQETAAELPGVKQVDNQIALIGEQPAERSDGWVTMKVMAALLFHKNVTATGTEVHTENGVVTLAGKVDSEAQKELTAEYAKDVEGVKDVRNELTVTKPEKPARASLLEKVDDASITAQLKTALLFHKSTQALATKVVTKDGVVTISGEAKTAAEKNLVAKLAEDIKGVKRVNNKMTVE